MSADAARYNWRMNGFCNDSPRAHVIAINPFQARLLVQGDSLELTAMQASQCTAQDCDE